VTTPTEPRRLSKAPKAATKLGALFAALVRRASDPALDPIKGVPVRDLASDCGLDSGYTSAQLCVLRRRGLAEAVYLGYWLPTDAGVAAARVLYGPNLEDLARP